MTRDGLSARDDERPLVDAALAAQRNAWAPYSRFRVGAAIEAEDGAIYAGCNVEIATFGATVCAERNALAAGVAAGARSFRRIVVVTDADDPVAPCGICRQVLAELGTELEVVLVGRNHAVKRLALSDLLPVPFTAADLGIDPTKR